MTNNVRKPTFWHVRPTKTQISLRICAVWSGSLLAACWNSESLSIQNAPSEDYDQTARMRRLIWIFAWRTCPKVRLQTSWPMFLWYYRMIMKLIRDVISGLISGFMLWIIILFSFQSGALSVFILIIMCSGTKQQWSRHTTKVQISLCICVGLSVSLLSAWTRFGSLGTHIPCRLRGCVGWSESLCWAHMQFCRKCCFSAHIIINISYVQSNLNSSNIDG